MKLSLKTFDEKCATQETIYPGFWYRANPWRYNGDGLRTLLWIVVNFFLHKTFVYFNTPHFYSL